MDFDKRIDFAALSRAHHVNSSNHSRKSQRLPRLYNTDNVPITKTKGHKSINCFPATRKMRQGEESRHSPSSKLSRWSARTPPAASHGRPNIVLRRKMKGCWCTNGDDGVCKISPQLGPTGPGVPSTVHYFFTREKSSLHHLCVGAWI
jgi:hypothetical protein